MNQPKITQDNVHLLLPSKVAQLADRLIQNGIVADMPTAVNVGVCYWNGRGVQRSYSNAVKWWIMAARGGVASAQYNLGLCYENGFGVKKSLDESRKWYQLAANQGHEKANRKVWDINKTKH